MGGHFLSDVLIAWLVMLLVLIGLRALILHGLAGGIRFSRSSCVLGTLDEGCGGSSLPCAVPGPLYVRRVSSLRATHKARDINKVVLAYSGGLDTSIILKWLQTTYDARCHLHRRSRPGEELEPARRKAEMLGIREIYIEDLREEFVRDFVFPMFRMNAVYEGVYLLGTSIARPLIAKRLVEIAAETGADAVAHGATGKGNDQVRFELTAYALNPDIKVIAPWREWELSRAPT
jgi:hypothetical protein